MQRREAPPLESRLLLALDLAMPLRKPKPRPSWAAPMPKGERAGSPNSVTVSEAAAVVLTARRGAARAAGAPSRASPRQPAELETASPAAELEMTLASHDPSRAFEDARCQCQLADVGGDRHID